MVYTKTPGSLQLNLWRACEPCFLQGSQLTCAVTLEARLSLSVYSITGRFSQETPATPPADPSRLSLKLGNAKVWKRAYLLWTTTWTNCKNRPPGSKNTKSVSKPYPVGTLKSLHRLKRYIAQIVFTFEPGAEAKLTLSLYASGGNSAFFFHFTATVHQVPTERVLGNNWIKAVVLSIPCFFYSFTSSLLPPTLTTLSARMGLYSALWYCCNNAYLNGSWPEKKQINMEITIKCYRSSLDWYVCSVNNE